MVAKRSVVEVEALRKQYGAVVAVDDLTFEVYEGEIFGMVGPNGAGKTTSIECVEGLRTPDRGTIRVLGLDPRSDRQEIRRRTGLQLQEAGLQRQIKVWEALELFAAFYSPRPDYSALIDRLRLNEIRNTRYERLSGGQKQRLFIALALINDPQLLFLDELSTGLDPQARRSIWELVEGLREEGKTIYLTTHSMEEAERLCDRVAILDRGHLVALDTPARLVAGLGEAEHRVSFRVGDSFDPTRIAGLAGVVRVERAGETVRVYGRGPDLAVQVAGALSSEGVRVEGFATASPSLEDVFLALTGREIRD